MMCVRFSQSISCAIPLFNVGIFEKRKKSKLNEIVL